ncbi:MAG: enoyl-[acyl-carrier-protein] reductase FabI [Rhodospirillaceae bacterium]|nr:enoyl-[acyl-carrier-protein] reductase FabI [Rhodospirillaceae bacterium]|tara:strand:+ start:5579 stop:6418 length:840 start_codon:yes stop_codon:yes gene_type:complete
MDSSNQIMNGKKGLVMGVANDRSLAWGIANMLGEHGADLAFTYQGEALRKRVEPLANSVNSNFLMECDVSNTDDVHSIFDKINDKWGKLDFFVHAIGFSDKNQLKGRYIDKITKDNFLNTMDISCFSFTELCRLAEPLMSNGGSCLTLTYYGAEKVMPHYNVMGIAKAALEASVKYLAMDMGRNNIRVNAISAGPVKTLASSGIGDFRYILKWNEYNSALKRNTTIEDVGGAALYLLSDLGRGTTGEIHHVDCGYHLVGMKAADAPDIAVVLEKTTKIK